MASSSVFSFLPASAPDSTTVKVSKGPRPYSIFEYLTGTGVSKEEAVDTAIGQFLGSDKLTENVAKAFYLTLLQWASTHKATVTTKAGKLVEIVTGLNMYGRPARAIRAFLEGKGAEDGPGLFLHCADMVHGMKAEHYVAFMKSFTDNLSKATAPAPIQPTAPAPRLLKGKASK